MEEFKKDFPLLVNRDIAYLDNAATTQKPKKVIESITNFYENYNANPHRGAYGLSIEATDMYENTRKKIAQFINAKNPEEIIFSKNATESLNLVANSYGMINISKGNDVVISIMEHHSNLVPWQEVTTSCSGELKYMYINSDFEISYDEIKEKITNNTKIVSITHVSNAIGTINDIKKIIKYAHEKGAVVVVDASQSIPHIKIDVQDLEVDFLVFSGHKMLAPLGIGVLYGKKELLDEMKPYIKGGDMIEYVHEQTTTYAPLPNKFEAGTQNIEGVVGLGSAIDYIQNIGYDKIQELENKIVSYAKKELSKLDYITLYLTPNEKNHTSTISFNVKGVHPHDVASILDSEGVCVRSGNHCAQPLMRFLNIDSTCRASFYFYNTKEDVDRLIKALNKVYKMFEKYIKKS